MRTLKNWCIACVRLYRLFGAPLLVSLGVRCRFSPSCSHYALESLELHGAGRGALFALRRLLRCHPFCAGGNDPVPRRKLGELGNG